MKSKWKTGAIECNKKKNNHHSRTIVVGYVTGLEEITREALSMRSCATTTTPQPKRIPNRMSAA